MAGPHFIKLHRKILYQSLKRFWHENSCTTKAASKDWKAGKLGSWGNSNACYISIRRLLVLLSCFPMNDTAHKCLSIHHSKPKEPVDGFWSAVRLGKFGINVHALPSEAKAPPNSACTPAGVIGYKSLKDDNLTLCCSLRAL